MARVQIHLLGGFEAVGTGGQALAIPTRKAQAVLARLARRPGEEVARARLTGLLWPDVPDEQGRASLRQALAALRRTPGLEQALVSHGDAVSLEPAAVDVDVERFEAALRAGPGGPASPDEALLHYPGAFLAGFPPLADAFDDWAQAERAALAARAQRAFRARLEVALRAGELERGLALAERALALDPAFELAYRARMQLHAAAGDRAAALREYERCRDALGRALGIAPSVETEALRREVLTRASPAPSEAGTEQPARGPSLAVLPFEVLSADPAHELFGRGLAEDILVELSRFRPVQVVARESAWRFDPRSADPAALGAALGAEWLLYGSVRPGTRLRVNVRLVHAPTGRQAWADRLEADLADVFAMQDRITCSVVSALALRIDEAELDAARRRPTESLDAYACWLRGMQLIRRGNREADLEGRRFFSRALELDPSFARAWSGLSLSHFNDWSCVAWERWDENEREALRCALEAARLDDRDHVTHCILGRILLYRREWERAAEHLDRSLSLNANDADVLAHLSLGYAYLGDHAKGLALGLTARQLHPLHGDWYFPCIATNHLAGRGPREMLDLLWRAPDGFVDTRGYMAVACGHLGEIETGRDHARRFLARFRSAIAHRSDVGEREALAWMMRINPLRREADRAYLLEGLERVGWSLSAAAAELSAP